MKPKSASHLRALIRQSERDGAKDDLIRKLQFEKEQLQAQVRRERRRADQHADELAATRMYYSDLEQRVAQRRENGRGW